MHRERSQMLAMICARPRRRVDRCVYRRTHNVLSALDEGECYARCRVRGLASYLRWPAIVALIGACARVARKVNCIACATSTWSGFIAGASMIVANVRGQLRRDDAQLALRLISRGSSSEYECAEATLRDHGIDEVLDDPRLLSALVEARQGGCASYALFSFVFVWDALMGYR